MNYADIPRLPRAHYRINIGWSYIEDHLAHWADRGDGDIGGLDLDPDYQRVHVWTESQQRMYIEYMLRGGEVGRTITWNCSTWGTTYATPIELVDGKQRLEAVRRFMRNELRVFGCLRSDFRGSLRPVDADLVFAVCTLPSRGAVLELYLNINAGGTPHTEEELARVRAMLAQQKEEAP